MTGPSSPPVSFDISGEVCVVTGGSGTLGGAMARGLSRSGANVAVLGRHADAVEEAVARLRAGGGEALGLVADVLEMGQLEAVSAHVMEKWGRVDVLVNAAGGNLPAATVPATGNMFDLAPEAFRAVVDLNLTGTLLPTLVFAKAMVAAGKGSIINISSMNASRPLSRTAGYGAAKAAVDNLTRWLADHVARHFSPRIRVNAIAPGFLLAEQNRSLLTNPDGSLTERGQAMVARTPMGRFGDPDDLVGPVVWLASAASSFVTGVVVPVDGGFSAASGI
jgi:NAD(P)-dependent dehydrogenase (short-subunit alcohol dehydrogenase family)